MAKHGESSTRLYHTLQHMKERCSRKNKNYGGRGIRVCDEWLGEDGYLHFKEWALSHGYADDLTIDRVDVNGNYSPENCRWIKMALQAKNKRTSKWLEYGGKAMILNDWARYTGIDCATINNRLRRGWSVGEALGFEQRASARRLGNAQLGNLGFKLTDNDIALSRLKEVGSFGTTVDELLKLGVKTPESAIYELRSKGVRVCSERVYTGEKDGRHRRFFVRYTLEEV